MAGIPNPMLWGGGDPLDEYFKILRGVRFRASATPRIERTTGASGGDRDKWFVLLNFKRGTLGAIQYLHGADTSSPDAIYINASDKLCVDIAGTNRLISNRLFRDPAAHYIALVVFDAANATAATRLRVYVADSPSPEVTAWDTDTRSGITAGTSKTMHNSILHVIGKNPAAASGYFDGYISEHRIGTWSGAATALVDHCSLHPRTGQWRTKAYAGSYGTHGSRLDFSDASSLSNLCLDRSGNGNNWTAVNISLTPGPTYDSMLDTPTNVFPTLNPLDKGSVTVSDGNLKVSIASFTQWIRANFGVTSGKWYYEFLPISTTFGDVYFTGIASAAANVAADPFSQSSIWFYYGSSGNKHNGGSGAAYGLPYGSANVVGVCVDMDNGAVYFARDNVWQSGGDPTSGPAKTGAAFSLPPGTYFPCIGSGSSTVTLVSAFNFGQRPFAYSPPAGFKALCTKNLPLFSGAVAASGSFAGNLSADGPFVWMNGSPETLTINGNPVTFGTHADRLSNGFKLRTASSSYNASGSNTWTATILSPSIKSMFRYQNARGNP